MACLRAIELCGCQISLLATLKKAEVPWKGYFATGDQLSYILWCLGRGWYKCSPNFPSSSEPGGRPSWIWTLIHLGFKRVRMTQAREAAAHETGSISAWAASLLKQRCLTRDGGVLPFHRSHGDPSLSLCQRSTITNNIYMVAPKLPVMITRLDAVTQLF